MSLKCKIRHCKKFQCPLSKISLRYQTVIDQRLTVFQQLFRWTSVGLSKCPIDKMIGLQGNMTVWAYPQVQHYIIQSLFQTYLGTRSQKCFWKSLKFNIRRCKNFHCSLINISLHYQTVIDQKLTVSHQLFSWTTVRSWKCQIHKMIGSQNHLKIWAVPWQQHDIIQRLFQG